MLDFSLDDSPNTTLHQVNHAHRYWVMQRMSKMGLYPGQQAVLIGLLKGEEDNENISQRQLADMIGISTASVATSIKRMERSGLVSRKSDKTDMRKNRLALTDKGREYAQQCQDIYQNADEMMFAGFDEKEKQKLTEYLTRMRDNMGWEYWSVEYRDKMYKQFMDSDRKRRENEHKNKKRR